MKNLQIRYGKVWKNSRAWEEIEKAGNQTDLFRTSGLSQAPIKTGGAPFKHLQGPQKSFAELKKGELNLN